MKGDEKRQPDNIVLNDHQTEDVTGGEADYRRFDPITGKVLLRHGDAGFDDPSNQWICKNCGRSNYLYMMACSCGSSRASSAKR